MDFSDPSDEILLNSMYIWEPSFSNMLFQDNDSDNFFNSSLSDGDLVQFCEEIEQSLPSRSCYNPAVEDISMDDDDQELLNAVNQIETELVFDFILYFGLFVVIALIMLYSYFIYVKFF